MKDKFYLRLTISQKERAILDHVKNITGFGSVNPVGVVHMYTCASLRGNEWTVRYFEQHKLKTKKKIAFLRWCDVRKRLMAKEHLVEGGKERIEPLMRAINQEGD